MKLLTTVEVCDLAERNGIKTFTVALLNFARALADRYAQQPIPMILFCPVCGMQHIDEPSTTPIPGTLSVLDWDNPPHRSHKCGGCGYIWRPADVPTEGVREIETQGDNDSPPIRGMEHGGWRG